MKTGRIGSAEQSTHLAALLLGNVALAVGPIFVRLADSGPVAAGFWRLFLALPLLAWLASANRQRLTGFTPAAWWAMAGAGVFFGLDLASWHLGIALTKLSNATLFANSGSLILMIWGLVALRRRPLKAEALAILCALGGAAILMGRSLELSAATLRGDLLCLLAGVFYTGYILLLQRARDTLGSWSLLFWSSLAGAPVLLAIAVAVGEPVWPGAWWPLVALMLGSQIAGQGLLVYALRHFSPLVIGLSLMTQPAIAVLAGWLVFDEALGVTDALGMVLVGAGLVMARAGR